MGSNPRSTVGTATDADAMLRILFSRLGKPHIGAPSAFSFNVASVHRERWAHGRARRQDHHRRAPASAAPAACARAARAAARSATSTCPRCTTTASRSTRARSRSPATAWTAGTGASSAAAASSTRTSRSRSTTSASCHDLLYKEPTKIKVEGINLTYAGLIPQIQKSFLSKDPDAHAAARPRLRGAGGDVHHLPRLRRHAAQRGGPVVEDRRRQDIADVSAMQITDLAEWVRDLDEPSVAPLLRDLAAHPRLVRRDRAGLPLAQPALGHAVGRRGAAHQDDPPPRLVADRRDLRLRRADDRPASRTTCSG